MAAMFKIEVVTPDATALAADASALQVPAWEGYLGVLANHAPLLCVLKPGVLTITQDDRKRYLAVRGGFMEVGENRVKILADEIADAQKQNRGTLEAALEQAKQPIGEVTGATAEDRENAREDRTRERELKILWTEARLKALQLHEEEGA